MKFNNNHNQENIQPLCRNCEKQIEEGVGGAVATNNTIFNEKSNEDQDLAPRAIKRCFQVPSCGCSEDMQVYVTMSVIVALAVIVTTVKILIENYV